MERWIFPQNGGKFDVVVKLQNKVVHEDTILFSYFPVILDKIWKDEVFHKTVENSL